MIMIIAKWYYVHLNCCIKYPPSVFYILFKYPTLPSVFYMLRELWQGHTHLGHPTPSLVLNLVLHPHQTPSLWSALALTTSIWSLQTLVSEIAQNKMTQFFKGPCFMVAFAILLATLLDAVSVEEDLTLTHSEKLVLDKVTPRIFC